MSDQTKYTQKLKGDKVLIIGGSAGIGYSVAEASLESGCTVIISSSNPSRVQASVSALQSAYPSHAANITGHACNLGDEATLEANIASLFDAVGGGIDHIVSTAGDSLAIKALQDVDLAFAKQAGMVRFFAPILIIKQAKAYMNPGPKSSITLTTGTVSQKPMPNWAVVNGFATGLQGLTRGFALDLKPIRVNLVSPGAVDTPLWAGMEKAEKEAMFKSLSEKMPVGSVAKPEDVAESYLYLMRDRNVTGTMISSNGGALLV